MSSIRIPARAMRILGAGALTLAIPCAVLAGCTRDDPADAASVVPGAPEAGIDGRIATGDGGSDASLVDAGFDARDARPAIRIDYDGGMDPDLTIPGTSSIIGAFWNCFVPGSQEGCISPESCRIAGPDSGRCENCTTCGTLGTTCDASTDCALFLQCHRGKCTNICPLDKPGSCVTECLDVGHSRYGVCRLP